MPDGPLVVKKGTPKMSGRASGGIPLPFGDLNETKLAIAARAAGFPLFELLRQLRHICAIRGDCLGCFISLNAPLGQAHDESRFPRFRFDLDLTAVPVCHDGLADW